MVVAIDGNFFESVGTSAKSVIINSNESMENWLKWF